jgi:hypothetical protein
VGEFEYRHGRFGEALLALALHVSCVLNLQRKILGIRETKVPIPATHLFQGKVKGWHIETRRMQQRQARRNLAIEFALPATIAGVVAVSPWLYVLRGHLPSDVIAVRKLEQEADDKRNAQSSEDGPKQKFWAKW